MKSCRLTSMCLRAPIFLGCLGVLAAAHGADTKPNAKPSVVATNSVALEVPIPQSVFEYDVKGVKDPFFPLSTRSPHLATQPPTEAPLSATLFKLKGLSGASGSALALINNRTVAMGETTEVTTTSGKHKIRCLEIRKFSALIRVEGLTDPIEIFLPKGDR
ncbi:MAG TPA: hypothetical protein VFC07_03940 [Verrucomicrobiae bacterium]|nr:hypothetical protein [Verrucomicrobiae bacterium]